MMVEKIGTPAMLEQLAEEATELAKAALKLARVHRRENPTPVTLDDATDDLVEEFTDVAQCAMELRIKPDREQMAKKRRRFIERWNEAVDAKKYIICCPMCDNRSCVKGSAKCEAEIWARSKKKEETDAGC